MTAPKQSPIHLPDGEKTGVRTQFGALCYRFKDGKLRILLITSRTRGRWILPKGWPEDGATPAETALREAEEEAGVEGRVTGTSIGLYTRVKTLPGKQELPCVVVIYPVRVVKLQSAYKEKAERKRGWFSLKKAVAAVENAELRQFLQDLDTTRLR